MHIEWRKRSENLLPEVAVIAHRVRASTRAIITAWPRFSEIWTGSNR